MFTSPVPCFCCPNMYTHLFLVILFGLIVLAPIFCWYGTAPWYPSFLGWYVVRYKKTKFIFLFIYLYYFIGVFAGTDNNTTGSESSSNSIQYPVDRLVTDNDIAHSTDGDDTTDNSNHVLRCQFCKRHVSWEWPVTVSE